MVGGARRIGRHSQTKPAMPTRVVVLPLTSPLCRGAIGLFSWSRFSPPAPMLCDNRTGPSPPQLGWAYQLRSLPPPAVGFNPRLADDAECRYTSPPERAEGCARARDLEGKPTRSRRAQSRAERSEHGRAPGARRSAPARHGRAWAWGRHQPPILVPCRPIVRSPTVPLRRPACPALLFGCPILQDGVPRPGRHPPDPTHS